MPPERMSRPSDPRTLTIPEDRRGLSGSIADPIVGLLQRDTGAVHPLQTDRTTFTIGTHTAADIYVERPRDRPFVSRQHCVLERRGSVVRVLDRGSRNGTFLDGSRVDDGVLAPGAQLVLAGEDGVRFVAMSRLMIAALPMARLLLGVHPTGIVDDYLSIAVRPHHIAMFTADGGLHRQLVETLHSVSGRRAMPLAIVNDLPWQLEDQHAFLETIQGGTLGLLLKDGMRVDQVMRGLLFGVEHEIRVVAVARSPEMAVQAIGADAFSRLHVVHVPSLRARAHELDSLIDAGLAQAQSPLRLGDLTVSNVDALRTYDWPGDLSEVWEVTRWIAAIDATGSIRNAAKVLAVPRTTLQGWLKDRRLTTPIR